MKRLITCGCSFMSPDIHNPRFIDTHFSQILAKELGYELIQLARPGASNGGICIQLEEAIRLKPDLILFGTTAFDRTEFSASPECANLGERFLTEKVRLEEVYGYGSNPILYSDNLMSIIPDTSWWNHKDSGKTVPNPEEKHNALVEWFKHLYIPKWKRQLDTYCMYAIQHKLLLSGIPSLKVIDLLESPDIPFFECVTGKKYSIFSYSASDYSGSYHTTIEEQHQIAEDIKKHL